MRDIDAILEEGFSEEKTNFDSLLSNPVRGKPYVL
jgi:hypothetical protein